MTSTWTIGATIYVLGAGLIALGENLVKRSSGPSKMPWRLWVVGVVTFVGGNMMHFVAFGFAPQSTLEMLGSSVLLWNLLLAPAFNKELIQRQHLVATGVILLGTSSALRFGPHGSRPHELKELPRLVSRLPFVIYEFLLLGVAAILHIVYLREESRTRGARDTREEEEACVDAKCEDGLPGGLDRAVSSSCRSRDGRACWSRSREGRATLGPAAFAASSAMIGSNSVLLSKTLSESLRLVLAGGNQGVGYVGPFFLVATWMSLAGFWLYRLNVALRRYSALFIVPVLQSSWMSFSIIGGGIFFEEFQSTSVWTLLLFGVSVVVIISGTMLMPVGSKGEKVHVEEEDLPEIEMCSTTSAEKIP
eukprot:TRINITY_DN64615_c0_g1_i1.p1 TRINITY_DN64615_c0_g1~~TRINITY_DN64615_c0_g1_i1.p1  ORF type:complete len:363 (+),score=74.12 TRINITY_DN64615_c0_g1_i1:201-1289(+)